MGAGSGAECCEAGEGRGELVGPGPGRLEAETGGPGGAGEAGGAVPEAVAKPFWFGSGEFAVEAEPLGPGDEVGGHEDEFEPGLVGREALAGKVFEAGGFGVADAVLDPGVAAVAGFEVGQVGVWGVGQEDLEAVPVGVGEAQVSAWMGPFAAHDGSAPRWPGGQIEADEPGQHGARA